MSFEEMWRDLAPVGRSASSGGYFRQPWASAESELRAWFAEECAARGLTVETDGIGNQVAWWEPRRRSTGDGPASSPARTSTPSSTAGRTTARWASSPRSRPSTCCGRAASSRPGRSGSSSSSRRRARASAAPASARGWSPARRRGTRRASCATATGSSSPTPSPAPGSTRRTGLLSLDRVGTFVELHVEQGRDLVDRDVAVGLASEIWPHGRWRFDFAGQANHAGTTRMEDRHDPMLTYAMTALAANKQARLAGQRATFGRIAVEPNGTNAVPSLVTAWLDARASSDDALAELVDAIERQADDRAGRDGTSLVVTAESVSGSVAFDADLAARLAGLGDWPVIPTQAGHDAGHPVRRRHPHRDGLRAQPHRRLALARRARRERRLPGRGRGARRRARRAGPGAPA